MVLVIQLRNDTTTNWTTTNPVLAQGEWGYDTILNLHKVGDGVTAWNSLAFYGVGPTGATGSAGLYSTTGTATLNFGATGATGSNMATVTVTGQTGITTSSPLVVFMRSDDSTSDHNSMAHAFAPIKLTGGSIIAGTGFTITGITDLRLTGSFLVRWAY